ncbi:F-box protein [Quillaja saponaria]|uniref:F-box protein n=1 Tax=Quillaja saponaria TaxID=32244 RepID=A0AAD7M0E9_QUISA|nr:F-box protein [Quillaja saponaria]
MSFIKRALVLCSSSAIDKFSLKCNVLGDSSPVKSWITAVVRRNVHCCSIMLDEIPDSFSLPYSLSTSATMNELFLEMQCVLSLPPKINFSSLEILTLQDVTFVESHSTQLIFSSCSVLRELFLDECNWVNPKVMTLPH